MSSVFNLRASAFSSVQWGSLCIALINLRGFVRLERVSRGVGSVSEDHFLVRRLGLNPSDFKGTVLRERLGQGCCGLVPFLWARVWRLEVNIWVSFLDYSLSSFFLIRPFT